MPSIYLSLAEIDAVRFCTGKLTDSLDATSDDSEREAIKTQIAQLRSIEKKARHAESARALKKAMHARYGQNTN